MHVFGNTYRGILGGLVTAELLALAAALSDVTSDWRKTIAGMILIAAPAAGALVDPGSQPPK